MGSPYYDVEETVDDRGRLDAAMVEWLLDEWMMTSEVCLSPLLGADEMYKSKNEPEMDEDEEGAR